MVAMRTFDKSRPGVGAQAVGVAQGALDEAAAFARTRKQFGKPIITFQAVAHMLADMATEIEAGPGPGLCHGPLHRLRGQGLLQGKRHHQGLPLGRGHAGHHQRGADVGRPRLHARLSRWKR